MGEGGPPPMPRHGWRPGIIRETGSASPSPRGRGLGEGERGVRTTSTPGFSIGKGPEERSQLFFQVGWLRERLGDFLPQQFPVALAQAMDCDPRGALV